MQGFEEGSWFPKTIGAIDGNHHPNMLITNTLVCDHKTLITHCYTGHPGSVHDQRVFRLSEVSNYLSDNEKFPANSHILGDAAYELNQHLLTPFRDNGHLNERQKNYNYRHSAARVTVERCIGLLKGRMRSLLHFLPMTRVDLMAKYVVARCVIHNICTLRKDEINVITISPCMQENVRDDNVLYQGIQNTGVHKRNLIMNTLQ
ncbi:putative nuclease HARBI1 [Cephus cinctus]|uniref:Nuclease HARBI1 n=1 Tax=Cephus cinctus TaxID=211228 RepID=A0AAJ7BUF4_CEPCN|nr:putative nuclease HARBI1 [Cephus cinctus]